MQSRGGDGVGRPLFAKFCWRRWGCWFAVMTMTVSKKIGERMMVSRKIDEETMREARTSCEEDALEIGFGFGAAAGSPDIHHPDGESMTAVHNFWIRVIQSVDFYYPLTMELLRHLIEPSYNLLII